MIFALFELVQLVLKMSTINLNACPQTNSPLLHRPVHYALVEQTPLLHKSLLQVMDVSYPSSIHSLLQNAPDLVVHRIEIWPVWRPVQWCDEAWCCALEQFHCLMSSVCWRAILLEYEEFSSNVPDRRQEACTAQFK